MRQNFAIICESAVIAEESKGLYILGTFDKITTNIFPAVLPKFSFVTNFSEGHGEHAIRISIQQEGTHTEIVSLDGVLNFGTSGQAQYIGNFIGLPFPQSGRYKFEIYVDGVIQPLFGTLDLIQEDR